MQIAYVPRGKGKEMKRVPHIDMGGGLLRPVPEAGHDIAKAAYAAQIECALGLPPVVHAPCVTVVCEPLREVPASATGVTVIRGPRLNGATSVSGGTRQRQHKDRSYFTGEFTQREYHLMARAFRKLDTGKVSKDYDCWKRHRRTQSRQKSLGDFFCTA